MHSVQDYLKRLPADKLEAFYRQCQQGNGEENYAYILPVIEKILECRRMTRSTSEQSGNPQDTA